VVFSLQILGHRRFVKKISFSYRVGHSTTTTIVNKTCEIIWEELKATVMPNPSAVSWRVTEQMFHKWNFPNCIGQPQMENVMIQAPGRSGSLYFNYKKYFSIVLLAMVDANYKFIAVDVGAYGSCSDGGVFANSSLGAALRKAHSNYHQTSQYLTLY
jgi:hypothetical protein